MTSRAKLWLKPPDQMDLWLAAQGYYRKHTARDGSCLFRAVSEQLFLTQAFHNEVRRHCIEFGLIYKHLFEKMTKSSIEDCLERLRCPSEAGGYLELNIMSKIYRCDFILFQEVGKPPVYGTNYGYDKKITLCVVQERHYDSVYTTERISNAAFCQSVVYETLYKNVFGLLEVDYAVKKMLRDKSSRYQRENSSGFLHNGMDIRLEMRDNCTNVKELLNLGVTPFPYKVAKSLDPEIYRNVEYDTWNEHRKASRYVKKVWNSHELGPGARCSVKLEDKIYHAFVQEMEPNKGPVLVFVEELGEKMTVPYESLELIPLPTTQPIPIPTLQPVHNRHSMRQSQTAKIAPTQQQQPESTATAGKKGFKNGSKMKSTQGAENKGKGSVDINGNSDNNLTCVPIISSSDYQQTHDDYQLHQDNNQNQHYMTQSCEVTSSIADIGENGKNDSHHQISAQISQSSCPPNAFYPVDGTPVDSNNNYAPSSVPSYCAVNIVPNRSVLPDGSDLPLTDISAVRYFYNLGLDYYVRSNCVVRHDVPTNGTCYPVIQSPAQYMPEPQHFQYVNVAYPSQQPNQKLNHPSVSTTSDGLQIAAVSPMREPVPPSPSVVSVTSESSSSNQSLVNHQMSSSHHVAPRFKNKRKPIKNVNSHNNHRNFSRDAVTNNNNAQYHNGKYHGTSNIQHPDVSAVGTSPVAQVPPLFPMSVPPPPLHEPPPPPPPPTSTISIAVPSPLNSIPPPNHPSYTFPVHPSYTPPNGPPAFYFQPVECDNYCPVTVGSYVEYSVIEPPPSGIYPSVLSQPPAPTQFSTAPYVTTDGIYYQQFVPTSTI